MIKKLLSVFTVLIILLPLLPVVRAGAAQPITIDAGAAILADIDSGELLYDHNADMRLYPASLTKITTALVVIDRCELTDMITVANGFDADLTVGSSLAGLVAGETMTVEQMLYCLLLSSGNDAANALAIHVAGSIKKFVEMMNAKAAEMGCINTHYTNPHGLHNDDHYTSARDVYLLTRAFIANPTLFEIANTVRIVLPPTNKHSKEQILNTTNYLISSHQYIDYFYTYARGVKTGYTDKAGYCLVSTASKDGLNLLSVVLKTKKDSDGKIMSFIETKRLFEWGFNNYKLQKLCSEGDKITEAAISGAHDITSVDAVAQGDITALMESDFDPIQIDLTPWLDKEVFEAPIIKGQRLGEANVVYNGVSYGRVVLVAANGVERINPSLNLIENATSLFDRTWFRLLLILLALLFILFLMMFTYFRRTRRLRRIRRRRFIG